MDSLLFTVLLDLGLIGIALLCLGEKLLPIVPSYALLVSFGLTVAHDTTGLLGVVFASTCGSVLGAIGW